MPLPLVVSCFSKIQTGFTFLVPAHPGGPGQRAVKRVSPCVCVWCVSSSAWASSRPRTRAVPTPPPAAARVAPACARRSRATSAPTTSAVTSSPTSSIRSRTSSNRPTEQRSSRPGFPRTIAGTQNMKFQGFSGPKQQRQPTTHDDAHCGVMCTIGRERAFPGLLAQSQRMNFPKVHYWFSTTSQLHDTQKSHPEDATIEITGRISHDAGFPVPPCSR